MRPTASRWADIKERDLEQCAMCGTEYSLTHQHRRAVGMGGSKIPPTVEDSLTLCYDDNRDAEGHLQINALVFGWKVRKWVKDPSLVPVCYPHSIGWARLTTGGHVEPIHAMEAEQMMREVYGEEWDRWCDEIGYLPPGRR